jgi:glycosyltransferase involved in cell wall biosynthesis
MSETKKIFIEAQRLFRKQKHGMDVVALELLHRLQNEETSYDKTVLVKKDKDHCFQSSKNLTVKILPAIFYPFWEQLVLPLFVSKQKNSLLHCTGNTAPVWGNTPMIVTIHDLIYLEDNYLFKKNAGSLYQRFGNYYRRLIVPRVAKRAKHIITVSEFQRQLIIERLCIPAAKVSVVYNGADERFFNRYSAGTIETVNKKYGIKNFPYIFFLANTEPRKNTDGVLKAFVQFCEQFPAYHHRLVIKGLSAEQLQKKIISCGAEAIADRIHRVGYITYEDMPLLYQGASMLWFPSFSEGFGLPIIEAMAGGTPVITSNCSVMPEIAADAALYIDPDRPAELVKQTVALLMDSSLKNMLIQKGRLRAKEFLWSQSVKSLLAIYESLLNSKE